MTPEVAAVLAGTSRYAVVCGDATAVMATIPDASVHVSYCMHPDTKVRLSATEEFVRVADVEVGARIAPGRTVLGKYSRHHDGPMLSLKVQGLPDRLVLTPEHRVLTIKGRPSHTRQDYRTNDAVWSARRADRADSVCVGDYVVIPFGGQERPVEWVWRNVNKRKGGGQLRETTFAPTSDLFRVIGYYAAEGFLQRKSAQYGRCPCSVSWGFCIDEADTYIKDMTDCIKRVFGLPVHWARFRDTGTARVWCHSTALAEFMHHYVPGLAPTKKLHPDLMVAPVECQMELLKGWLRGDGGMDASSRGRSKLMGTTTSLEMANQMFTIAIRCGLRPSMKRRQNKDTTSDRFGNAPSTYSTANNGNHRPIYDVYFASEDAQRLGWDVAARSFRSTRRIINGHMLARVREIETLDYDGPVWDLDVDGDDLFAAPFALVHNCDPPYGLSKQDTSHIVECLQKWLAGQVYTHEAPGFMSTDWDSFVPGPEAWREVHRVLKPGGYCVAFSSTRTVDLLGIAIRLAGFELRQGLYWAFGGGFPKSLDVSDAINAFETTGKSDSKAMYDGTARDREGQHWSAFPKAKRVGSGEKPAVTDNAALWDGYGTDVKPAVEPLVVARKALDGTVAGNVQKHGCGALNIDAARIGTTKNVPGGALPTVDCLASYGERPGRKGKSEDDDGRNPNVGRFPAALAIVHDEDCELVGVRQVRGDARQGGGERPSGFVDTGSDSGDGVPCSRGHADADGMESVDEWICTPTCAAAELARQSGESASSDRPRNNSARPRSCAKGAETDHVTGGFSDVGSAARFFYNAKASASDRLAYITCSIGCAHHESVAGVREARESARDPRRECIAGDCRDDARDRTDGAIVALLAEARRKDADTGDFAAVGASCVDAGRILRAVAEAVYEGDATSAIVRSPLSTRVAETTDVLDSEACPTFKHTTDSAWPRDGYCRACHHARGHYQHNTVKPQSLADHHAKLLSLPAHVDAIALVPYCGSGVEAAAMLAVGFRVIAIDIDTRHVAMTTYRLANVGRVTDEPKRTVSRAAPSKPVKVTAQLDLFGK